MKTFSNKTGYQYKENCGVGFFSIPSFDDENILNCFSSRKGGVSEFPYDSLNMSLTRPCAYSNETLINYNLLASALKIETGQMVIVNYCHGDGIQIVNNDDCGNGLLFPNKLPPCDALVTNKKNVALTTIHADCTSYLIFDKVNHVIAACHAGWKGTLLRIGSKTINKMSDYYGTKASDCIVGIGPNISYERFEVDKPVADEFLIAYGADDDIVRYNQARNKYMVNLTKCATSQFVEVGVDINMITVADLCTYDDSEHFFSYRRDGQKAGAMVSVIMMRE